MACCPRVPQHDQTVLMYRRGRVTVHAPHVTCLEVRAGPMQCTRHHTLPSPHAVSNAPYPAVPVRAGPMQCACHHALPSPQALSSILPFPRWSQASVPAVHPKRLHLLLARRRRERCCRRRLVGAGRKLALGSSCSPTLKWRPRPEAMCHSRWQCKGCGQARDGEAGRALCLLVLVRSHSTVFLGRHSTKHAGAGTHPDADLVG